MDAAADTPAKSERDPRAAVREARAEQYLKRDLEDQRRWYGERASRYKARTQALGIAVVAAGAATSFLQVFRDARWVPVLTALLGPWWRRPRAGGRSPATTRPGPPTGWPASG